MQTLSPPAALSRAALARMVAGAASFAERLGPAFRPAKDADPAIARARLARWRELVARGNGEAFARRLAWDGLTEADALRGVGDVRMAEGAPLPEWARVAAEACAIAPEPADGDPLLAVAPAWLPCREMVLPVVHAARARLRDAADTRHALFSPEVHLQYESALLKRLCDHAERAVHALRTEDGGAGDEGGLAALFIRYPVLARILAQGALDWVHATAELLARLHDDRAELGRAFGAGGDPGQVADARAGLSDAHGGGRTVSILRFADGTAAVYKPRPLGAERGFAVVAGWLNGVAEGAELRPLQVLDRGSYGWTAYARPAECDDEAAVERFWERGGKLLCLAYLLGGEDLHMENVIACGEHPVLIDLEVMLRACAAEDGFGPSLGMPHWKDDWHSVLSPGLLPRLTALPDGDNYAAGGLVDCGPAYRNVPVLRGQVAAHDAGIVERGFRRAFRAVVVGRDALLAPDGPMSSFGGDRSRVILRNTSIYGSLLQRTLSPRFLESGAERSIEIDVLVRPVVRQAERHPLWLAFRDEARQLEQMDVPAFHMSAAETALATGLGSVPGFAKQSGLDRAREKLRALRLEEMEEQAQCIRVAYASQRLRGGWADRDAAAAVEGQAAHALAAAAEVAVWLRELAVDAQDGAPSWIALGGGRVEDAGPGLAQGRGGIGLFLAALAAVTGDDGHRGMALRTLAPVAAAVRDPSTRDGMRERMGIGATRGMGGVAWALLRAGDLLEDDDLRAAAVDAAECITPAAIRADRELDVFGGAAGALLALLALHASTGGAGLLDRAQLCGAHLLATREADPVTGLRAWRRAGDGDLGTGFGHGAAGIAHALVRLHRVTGEDDLLAAAEEAFAFERSLARAAEGDWLDRAGERADPPAGRPLCAWCHGAAGIGLARAAALDVAASDAVRDDLLRAVEAAGRAPSSGPATLCCGAMGRAELLLRAADALGRPELAERARALGAETATRAARRGTYGAATLDTAFTPGLFQGIAGIGYGLLRLHHPHRVPSVLLWD